MAGLGADAAAGEDAGSAEIIGCANAAVDAMMPAVQMSKFNNMRKLNPLVVYVVLLRHAPIGIGSSPRA